MVTLQVAARDLFSIVGRLGLLETELRLFLHKVFPSLPIVMLIATVYCLGH